MRPCSLALIGAVMGIAAAAAAAEEPATRHLSVETSVELGLQLAGERNLFWNLPEVFAPAGAYDTDRHWWEVYVKPGVHAQRPLPGGAALYGQLSAVGSGTLEKDPFDAGNTGRLTLETAVAGVRTPLAGTAWQADLSLGAQAFTVGTGMLIANGASNGFDRGALKLGPRKAFERTAVARLTDGATTAEAFYLDPNENPDSDSGTRLAGAALTYKQPDADRLAGLAVGLAVGRVIESAAPYVQAAPGGSGPPTILDGARDGLRFVHAFGRWPVFERLRPGLWLGADVAWERNPRIDLHARAWRLQAGAAWNDRAWRPKLTVGMQRFSGDDPSTPGLERFDPLFYEGSPGAWASGSKASMVFINTNVRALQASLELRPTPRDIVTVYLAHLRADELRSPLQFGQATRVDIADGVSSIVAGVTHPHLADDVFVKYTRVVDRHTYVTAGYSASFPGAAIQRLLGGRSPVWSGWLVNLVLAY